MDCCCVHGSIHVKFLVFEATLILGKKGQTPKAVALSLRKLCSCGGVCLGLPSRLTVRGPKLRLGCWEVDRKGVEVYREWIGRRTASINANSATPKLRNPRS